MKIGIDLSQIVYSGTGVGRYTEGLVRAILKYEKKHDWYFFFSSLRQPFPTNLEQMIKHRGYRLRKYFFPPSILSLLWNQFHVMDLRYLMGNLDWFISSDWTEPPYRNVRKATIIHDLVFLRFPETVAWQILKTQQQRLQHVCQETDLILADSLTTKQDIERLLTLKKAKVKLLYPGLNLQKPDKKTIDSILSRLGLRQNRFLLTVGKLEPRKNLERLIRAYEFLRTDFPLVIVGPKGWGNLDLSGKNVRVVGYLSDAQLNSLYQSCYLFVYPSLYEGFGYPLLEAAYFQAPLAVANTSSLAELGAGISEQFDPKNINEMVRAMQYLLDHPRQAKALGYKAGRKAAQFSWQQTYNHLINYLTKT